MNFRPLTEPEGYIIANMTVTSEVAFGEHIPNIVDGVYNSLSREASFNQLENVDPMTLTLAGEG